VLQAVAEAVTAVAECPFRAEHEWSLIVDLYGQVGVVGGIQVSIQAVTGGSQGLQVRARWMASRVRMPWFRALVR
jgi:hypothetical protein